MAEPAAGTVSRALADAIAALNRRLRQAARLRTAELNSAAAGVATITLGGGSVPGVPYLASYTPTAGDSVLVLQTDDGQLIILGKPA